MKKISIQENENILSALKDKRLISNSIINNTSYIISFCGVQPIIDIADNKTVLLKWELENDTPCIFSVSNYGVVIIGKQDIDGIVNIVKRTDVHDAILYYKEELHDKLFVA